MSFAGMVTRRIKQVFAWMVAIAVLVLIGLGVLWVADAAAVGVVDAAAGAAVGFVAPTAPHHGGST